MGGQACVPYGAAEFTRDLDLAIRWEASFLFHSRFLLHMVMRGLARRDGLSGGYCNIRR